jgi:hypothetical protein
VNRVLSADVAVPNQAPCFEGAQHENSASKGSNHASSKYESRKPYEIKLYDAVACHI